ncbi:NAD+ kinase [Dialister histaminiformans]|uniref:NAD kinase n=2 Tax=Allisonella histaminiformans TaxID=209880 RepID=A0A1G5VQ05_9FIRM|nr:MAG: NAD(+) kinase [Veillonellaceae bacterium]SDA47960.1 NAD+ kinase [Allisonella histaminiformans]
MIFAVFPNLGKKEFYTLFKRLEDIFASMHITCVFPDYYRESAEKHGLFLKPEQYRSLNWIGNNASCVISIGGDGTYLSLACTMAEYEVLQVGIHMGDFGFLNLISQDELEQRIHDLYTGNYLIEDRIFLEAELVHTDGTRQSLPLALNDIVVGHNEIGKMVRLNLSINDLFIQTYAADGVIVSSATGSTSYSLSCGGPVLPADSREILVVPVCTHTGLRSPLLIPEGGSVQITIPEREKKVHISLDGTYSYSMTPEDKLIVRGRKQKIRFIRFRDQDFYRMLTRKFAQYAKNE